MFKVMRNLQSKFVIPALLASLLPLLAACSSETKAPGQTVPGIEVEISASTCPSLDVRVGDQVTWTNIDQEVHLVKAAYADGLTMFESGDLQNGDSFSFVFSDAGQYEYICSANGISNGIITVEP